MSECLATGRIELEDAKRFNVRCVAKHIKSFKEGDGVVRGQIVNVHFLSFRVARHVHDTIRG